MSKQLDYSGPGEGTAIGLERLSDVSFIYIDQMCEAVKTWGLEFRPLRLPPVGDSMGRISQSRCGPLEIGHARILTVIDQMGAPPAGLLTFVILEKRLRKLWWRGYDVGSDRVLVFPVGSELRSLSGSDFEIHTISVAEKVVAELCDELEVRWPGCRGHPEVFQVPSYVLEFIRQKLRRFRDGSMEEPWPKAASSCLILSPLG